MLENCCQLNTGFTLLGSERKCPIERVETVLYLRQTFFDGTRIPRMDIQSGEIAPSVWTTVIHSSKPYFDLWDMTLKEIQENQARVAARTVIPLSDLVEDFNRRRNVSNIIPFPKTERKHLSISSIGV